MTEPGGGTPMRTKVVAQIADWQGEAVFDRVRVVRRSRDTLVIELATRRAISSR